MMPPGPAIVWSMRCNGPRRRDYAALRSSIFSYRPTGTISATVPSGERYLIGISPGFDRMVPPLATTFSAKPR
jgi:hypothetical protein